MLLSIPRAQYKVALIQSQDYGLEKPGMRLSPIQWLQRWESTACMDRVVDRIEVHMLPR
jgi:hypothetical protein